MALVCMRSRTSVGSSRTTNIFLAVIWLPLRGFSFSGFNSLYNVEELFGGVQKSGKFWSQYILIICLQHTSITIQAFVSLSLSLVS